MLTIDEVLEELDRAGMPIDYQQGENGVTSLCPCCPKMMSWTEAWQRWICDNPECRSHTDPGAIGHELTFRSSAPFTEVSSGVPEVPTPYGTGTSGPLRR